MTRRYLSTYKAARKVLTLLLAPANATLNFFAAALCRLDKYELILYGLLCTLPLPSPCCGRGDSEATYIWSRMVFSPVLAAWVSKPTYGRLWPFRCAGGVGF